MVSSISIFFMFFTLIIIILFPVSLGIYLYKKENITWKPFLIGALVFFIFQFMTRLPIISILNTQIWFQNMINNFIFGVVIVGGISAGLFEEIGRYLGFKYLLKNKLCWKNGVAMGIGHGGMEAIGLVGLTYINNIIMSIMINTGAFDRVVAPNLSEQTAELIKYQFIDTSSHLFLAAGIERIFSIIIQIALSLVILYGVANKIIIFLLYGIILHTFVNVSTVMISQQFSNIWITELYIFIMALIAFIFIKKSINYFETT